MKFIKKLFGINKNEEPQKEGQYVRIQLNERVMPIDRGDIYEDPIDEIIKSQSIGEVTGGGTLQSKSGEIEYCDLEIFINSETIDDEILNLLRTSVEKLGAPKGSKLIIERTGEEILIGKYEGLGIYLDGKNLPANVYEENDINLVIEKLKELLDDKSEIIRYWEGNEETALYFYGKSFDEMKAKIQEYISQQPLCQNSRIEQIA